MSFGYTFDCSNFGTFEEINVAMGNTRPASYSYCVDAQAGIDEYIISWEMASVQSVSVCTCTSR